MDRRFVLTGLTASAFSGLGLTACETLDPTVLNSILAAGALTQGEAAQGIRAALNNGIGQAISTTGQLNGFLGDDLIRIPLPGFMQDLQNTLRPEKAVPVAKDIFVDAVSSLTITDALNIVRGPDNAATSFLQQQTTPRLTQLFNPQLWIMPLDKLGRCALWINYPVTYLAYLLPRSSARTPKQTLLATGLIMA